LSIISSDIIALNFDGLSSPNIELKFKRDGQIGDHTLGWGLAWFPKDTNAAIVTKDPSAKDANSLKGAIDDWENFRSTVFFCKVRGAASGYTHLETQPFSRSFAGQDWVFMHNGNLDKARLQELHRNRNIFLEPLGRTDSELAFCFLLGKIQDYGARTIAEIDHSILAAWFSQLDDLGSADMVLSDGISVVAFYGTNSESGLYYKRIGPPHSNEGFANDFSAFAITNPRDTFRTALVVSSTKFEEGNWTAFEKGQLIISRRGSIVWSSLDEKTKPDPYIIGFTDPKYIEPMRQNTDANADLMRTIQAQAQQLSIMQSLQQMPNVQHNILNLRSMTHSADGSPLTYKLYELVHSTEYSYEKLVEHSTHTFRLAPVEDNLQEVIHSTLSISSEGEEIRFEDVFGNQNLHYSIRTPYQKLVVSCHSVLKIYGQAPDNYSSIHRQTYLPLNMMPWQRRMMDPYLVPNELPEAQLTELMTYAMSFAERNGRHLIDTLNDINQTIYRDYQYVPGSTSLSTTPFEVYAQRKGVCQDFANLFISLVRLLGVPARYRVGYIYTGANYENKIQSDASHAWVEIYLPYIGWRGFDPTNGCTIGQEHIRVACGRNYMDATPTGGTIYRGGGRETLNVQVRMTEIFPQS
jgi:transglutaminase-like putative cysteine protease/predicted glutamine amidotransferase